MKGRELMRSPPHLRADRHAGEYAVQFPVDGKRHCHHQGAERPGAACHPGSHARLSRPLYGADPAGKRLSWFDGKDYWVMDVATCARTNVTAKLTGVQKIDFVDREDDHPNNVLPSNGAPVWSKDGTTMLVSNEYDLWSLSLDGITLTTKDAKPLPASD